MCHGSAAVNGPQRLSIAWPSLAHPHIGLQRRPQGRERPRCGAAHTWTTQDSGAGPSPRLRGPSSMPAVGVARGESNQEIGRLWEGNTNLPVPISTGTTFNSEGSSLYQPSGQKRITVYSQGVKPTSHRGALVSAS